jgi:hypothetical protein
LFIEATGLFVLIKDFLSFTHDFFSILFSELGDSSYLLSVGIVSNQLNLVSLSPNFVTGFCDGECCFSLSISQSKTHRIGWVIRPRFEITLHKKDKVLLQMIQASFKGVGKIYIHGSSVYYQVISFKDFLVIINHFDKYPLLTQKRADGEARSASTFKQILSLWSMNLFKLYFI